MEVILPKNASPEVREETVNALLDLVKSIGAETTPEGRKEKTVKGFNNLPEHIYEGPVDTERIGAFIEELFGPAK